jgi:ribosomal protein S18 acetylase RimI-like enzyme
MHPVAKPLFKHGGFVSELLVVAVPLERTRALRRAILRPQQTLEQLAAHESEDAFAVGAFEDGELIAVGFVVPDGEPGDWRIRGMATAPAARGRGVGTAVLDALIAHASAQGASRIWCNARLPARSLYERAGLRVVSECFELPEIGPHYVMERRLSAT